MNKKLNVYLIVVLSLLLITAFVVIAVLLGKRTVTTSEASKPQVIVQLKEKEQESIKTVSQIAEEQGIATVFIATYSKIGLELGLGSGFIVSKDGKIITNFHVIDDAYSASVKLTNGDVYDDISVIDYDERRDLAIIKIKGFNLPVANIGDSNNLKIGEKILVIGNPAGLENSISDGIISATRDTEGYKLLQITAPISPGSSGGPVYNMKGEVVGIATSTIQEAQNLNFAVPMNYAKPLLEKEGLVDLGEFQDNFQKRKWIGGKFDIAKRKPIPVQEEKNIGYLGCFWDLTQPKDVFKIWGFKKYSPAKDSSLEAGDEIIKIDDFILREASFEEREEFLRSKRNGDAAVFKILRNSKEEEVAVTFGKRPKPTTIHEAIAELLFLEREVRLAIMVDEISFMGPNSSYAQLSEWKKSIRRNLLNNVQKDLMSYADHKEFSIVDTGKIDVIVNDLENRYGALPPQIRNNVLQSLGVTHLLEISYDRYYEQKYFQDFWIGGKWKEKTTDSATFKLIDLMFEEIVCIDIMKTVKDYNDKEWREPEYDSEDKEYWDYLKEMRELLAKQDLKNKKGKKE